jgi:hypothetical protein
MHDSRLSDIDVRLINDPRRSEEAQRLLPVLAAIARNGFGTAMTAEDVQTHVTGVDRLYLIRERENIVGFSSYDQHDDVLYLNGIVVHRDCQKRGIFGHVNSIALRDAYPAHFAMRTQNPVVYGATKKIVREIYPREPLLPPKHILEIARRYGGGQMEEDTFVIRGCYGTSLYDRIPAHEDRRLFDNVLKLDYGRGDAVIIVGVL